MRLVRSLLKLTRIDSSTLVAAAAFFPIFARTGSLALSVGRAAPLLFIGMCTFIANDLDDIERDRINHPDRPLPSQDITTALAACLYFSCLATALLLIKYFIRSELAFLYYLLLVLSISYRYVVEFFPGFKSLYVASATSIPALIVATTYPSERRLLFVAASVFLFVLGRELCMDFVDRAGDKKSFMHKIDAMSISVVAFALQGLGLLLLAVHADKSLYLAALAVIGLLLLSSGVSWFRFASYRKAIVIMKLQLFVGLSFLL